MIIAISTQLKIVQFATACLWLYNNIVLMAEQPC